MSKTFVKWQASSCSTGFQPVPRCASYASRHGLKTRATWFTAALMAMVIGVVGCAPARHATTAPTTRLAATRGDEPAEAFLSLNEIEPKPILAELKASTKPTTAPSLDAIELYARARGAMGDGQRFN